MQVCQVSGYDNKTSFGSLCAAKKGAQVLIRKVEARAVKTGSNKMYALYHGALPEAKRVVNLPPAVQAFRKYLAGDFRKTTLS